MKSLEEIIEEINTLVKEAEKAGYKINSLTPKWMDSSLCSRSSYTLQRIVYDIDSYQ